MGVSTLCSLPPQICTWASGSPGAQRRLLFSQTCRERPGMLVALWNVPSPRTTLGGSKERWGWDSNMSLLDSRKGLDFNCLFFPPQGSLLSGTSPTSRSRGPAVSLLWSGPVGHQTTWHCWMGKTELEAWSSLVHYGSRARDEGRAGQRGPWGSKPRATRRDATQSKRILFQEAPSFDSAGYQNFKLTSFLSFMYLHFKKTQFIIIDRKPAFVDISRNNR